MDTLWIGNGQLVLPQRVLENGSILIEDGRIVEIGYPCPQDVQRVDAEGGYILPGFIDLHVHGGGGADAMDATVQALKTMARTHAAHGTTALVPTTMTCEDALLERVIDRFLEARSAAAEGAQLLGLHLEGPFFAASSRGAQPVLCQRVPDRVMLERILRRAQGHILRWDAAPELEQMELFAQVMKANGVMAAVAHTSATAEQAMRAFDWGFSHVTHFYNAMTTFHKVNGIVHAGVIEAAYLREDVTIELIGDGCHVPRESMLLANRIKGADRICLITDAMRAAGTDASRSILGPEKGGVPVVIRDSVAQLTDLSSYAGSIATMDRVFRVAHLRYGIPVCEVSRMLSLVPARLCGCVHRKGSLERGKDADIVVMSADGYVRDVYIGGRRFNAA